MNIMDLQLIIAELKKENAELRQYKEERFWTIQRDDVISIAEDLDMDLSDTDLLRIKNDMANREIIDWENCYESIGDYLEETFSTK